MNSFAPDIGILGAGAWGTALAVLWAREGRRVALWARDPATAAAMRQTRQTARLPGAKIPETIDIIDAFPDAAVLVVCVPMQHLRALLAQLPPSDTPLVLCCKGLESETLLLPPERAASSRPAQTIAILTGPNFAHEIAAGLPAAAVLAAENQQLRAQLMAALKTETLRLYGSADVTGAALGGAAKNVIAIAAGVVMGARPRRKRPRRPHHPRHRRNLPPRRQPRRPRRNHRRPVRARRPAAHLHRRRQP